MSDKTGVEKIDFRRFWRLYRIFGRHYRKYIGTLLISAASMLGGIGVALLAPWPLALILDVIIEKGAIPSQVAFLGPWIAAHTMQALAVLAGAIVVLKTLESLLTYFDKYLVSIVGEYMVADIRERIFEHLQRLSLSFHRGSESADVIYRMTKDVKDIKKLLINAPQDLLQKGLTLLFFAGAMLLLSWKLALVALAVVPLMYHFTYRTGVGIQKAEKKRRKKEGKVAHIVGENVKAMALIQAYGQQAAERDHFEQQNQASLQAELRAIRLASTFKRLMEMLVACGTAGVLYLGGRVVLDGGLSYGLLYVFYKYTEELYGPIDKLAETFVSLAKDQVAGERTMELVESDMILHDSPKAIEAPRFAGAVEFRDVSFGYKKDQPVLKGLSLVVKAGETVALVGHSGAGKSTLISLLLRFYDPDEGEILIDGRPIRDFKLRSLRSRMTIVLQNAFLQRKTIRENIAFGRAGATDAEVVEAAKQAEAHDFISRLEKGYDTLLAEEGRNLSGGQRQRLSIARAMLRDTPIVILDEPATGLDAESADKVGEAIAHLTEHRTTFIIAHRLATIRNADRILMLEDGAVAEQGTHEQLLASSATYRELYELQSGRNTAA